MVGVILLVICIERFLAWGARGKISVGPEKSNAGRRYVSQGDDNPAVVVILGIPAAAVIQDSLPQRGLLYKSIRCLVRRSKWLRIQHHHRRQKIVISPELGVVGEAGMQAAACHPGQKPHTCQRQQEDKGAHKQPIPPAALRSSLPERSFRNRHTFLSFL